MFRDLSQIINKKEESKRLNESFDQKYKSIISEKTDKNEIQDYVERVTSGLIGLQNAIKENKAENEFTIFINEASKMLKILTKNEGEVVGKKITKDGCDWEVTSVEDGNAILTCISDKDKEAQKIKLDDLDKYINEGKNAPKKIKKYSKVKIGDVAFENPDAGGEWNNELGKVVWKGSINDLRKSKYKNLESDFTDGMEMDKEDWDEYDLIVIKLPRYGDTLFNYNNDPSGCVVFK